MSTLNPFQANRHLVSMKEALIAHIKLTRTTVLKKHFYAKKALKEAFVKEVSRLIVDISHYDAEIDRHNYDMFMSQFDDAVSRFSKQFDPQ